MWPAISVFFVVTVSIYGLALLFVRGDKNRELEVFAAGRRRPLIFGPPTGALAGAIPCSSSTRANITKQLQRAGYYHRFAFEEFAALRNVLTVGWVFFVGTLIVVAAEPGDHSTGRLVLVGLVGAALCYGLPRLILHTRANGRAMRIEYALPDALDMITMCMTGGLPLEQALGRVGKELGSTHPDLACELRILGRQMDAGSSDSAITQFADRIDTCDVQSLAAMVRQTSSQGSSAAAAFQDFADGVRRTRRQRAEERGNKATVKLLFPLVFCLAPPIYMLLLIPAVIELRSFVLQENQAGGILSPGTYTADEGILPPVSSLGEENVTDRFSYLSFTGEAQEGNGPQ
jgi:tight adherence protein C